MGNLKYTSLKWQHRNIEDLTVNIQEMEICPYFDVHKEAGFRAKRLLCQIFEKSSYCSFIGIYCEWNWGLQ